MLTIAIPTYNRVDKIDQTLSAIAQWKGELAKVPLRVHDNASTDATPSILEKWKVFFGVRLTVVRHPQNLGLVNNYISCIVACETDYVWVMGDDDNVMESGAHAVLHLLKQNPEIGILHLNYRPVSGITHEPLKPHALPLDMNERFTNGRDFVEAAQRFEYGSLMFITAVVLRCDLAKCVLAKNEIPHSNLALPFYISAVLAAKNNAKLVAENVFDGIYGVGSWQKSYFKVFYLDLPEVVMTLIKGHNFSKGLLESYLARYGFNLFRLNRYLIQHPKMWWRGLKMLRRAQVLQKAIK